MNIILNREINEYKLSAKMIKKVMDKLTNENGNKKVINKDITDTLNDSSWVLTGNVENLYLKNPFGEVKKLFYKKVKKNDVTLALQDMKEIIKDWVCAVNQYI